MSSAFLLSLALSAVACGDGVEATDQMLPPVTTGDTGVPPGPLDTGVPPVATQDASVTNPPPSTGGLFPRPDASVGPGPGAMEAGMPDSGVAQNPPDGGPAITPEGGTDGGGGTGKTGDCCPDGNCLCHGPAPTALTSARGPFKVASARLSTGTVHYPTDAEAPLASVALCGGFTNSGPEMADWGPFYASHGIVTIIVNTGALDFPDVRARALAGAIAELKKQHTTAGSPLMGKLSDRYGTSGYSMGGGGTTLATQADQTLKTSVGLAAWSPVGARVTTPTLFLCGSADGTAPCSQSSGAYRGIAETTPKMMVEIAGATHFSWFAPVDAGRGVSGQYALAFQKVYLEGDTRWKPLLLTKASGATVTTNIK